MIEPSLPQLEQHGAAHEVLSCRTAQKNIRVFKGIAMELAERIKAMPPSADCEPEQAELKALHLHIERLKRQLVPEAERVARGG